MENFCIPPELINNVKEIVTTNSSISRDKQLAELFGSPEMAKKVNTAYEKSLLLVNQKNAIEKFINSFTELGQEQKLKMKESIANRLANRTEKITQDDLLAIAQDIYNKKYKIDIPLEDIARINEQKKVIDSLPEFSIEKGRAIYDMDRIIEDLKSPRNKLGIKDTIQSILKETAQRFEGKTPFEKSIEGIKIAADIATSSIYKSIQASADLSYGLRQGLKVLTTNPKVWKENWLNSFKNFTTWSAAERELAHREWVATVISDPMYESMVKSKLGIGVIEDFFPTTLAEKIPLLSDIFKRSNVAFTQFSQGSRIGLWKEFVNKATQDGVEITPQLLKDFAEVANSFTGRGKLSIGGRSLESQAGLINKVFYSGRYIKSAIDTFTMPFDTSLSPLARAEARKASLRNIGVISTILYTASLFRPVELDPRSSKFGKVNVGNNTWVDITGGLGSYITLASRIATQESKSATTGKISKLGTGKFGSRTGFDVAVDFATNKLAPAPSTIVQILKGKDFSGNKPTLGGVARNLSAPLAPANAIQQAFSDNDFSTALFSTLADINGLNSTDYNKFKKTGK
jgi:uncharacterized protein YdcH (DUF465 family)